MSAASVLPGHFFSHTSCNLSSPEDHLSPLALKNVIVNFCISVCFDSPGDGGHGYLKDWLWWAGLLTSK